MVVITINEKTPSMNHLYSQSKFGRRFMTPKAKVLKLRIINSTSEQAKQQNFILNDWREKLLKVTVEIHEDWWTLKDTVKKKDIANKEKFLIDSIMDGLDLDDSFIWEHTMRKVDSEVFKAVVKIEQYRGLKTPC